jgi:hypothetical protein
MLMQKRHICLYGGVYKPKAWRPRERERAEGNIISMFPQTSITKEGDSIEVSSREMYQWLHVP